MIPISVLVPTANRPAMLRTALRSVAAQTALSTVTEVVVIENLGNRASEAVCQEFPQLPIRYVYRDPPIPPGIEASRDALSRIRCQRLALLFDDDWWMEKHLENAMTSFKNHPGAVASYAGCLWTTGEEGYLTGVYGSFLPWFGASKPMEAHRLALDLEDLLVISHINTAFHYSTLVVDSDVFRRGMECFANGNPYDTDRLIPVELGLHGKVIYDSRPQVYIRMHGGREAHRIIASGEDERWWQKSSEQLSELAKKEHIDLKKEFAIRMKDKSITVNDIRNVSNPQCFATLGELRILNMSAEPNHNLSDSVIAKIYREIAPPFLRRMLASLRDKF